jgi:hypothetical protein
MLELRRLLILLLTLYKKPLKKYFTGNLNSALFDFFIRNQIGERFFGILLQNCDVHNKSMAGTLRLIKSQTFYFLSHFINDNIYKNLKVIDYPATPTSVVKKSILMTPPSLIISDLLRKSFGKKYCKVNSIILGGCRLGDVYRVSGSNAHINSNGSIFIDEYQYLFSDSNATKNEAFK